MPSVTETTSSETTSPKAPKRPLFKETLAEGLKELTKRVAQGIVGLALLVAAFIITLLVSAYYFLIEPRLARRIAEIITTDNNFPNDASRTGSKSANPLDDYILRVFLAEISKNNETPSEQVEKIRHALKIGDIKEGFRIFSHSVGHEMDTLDQIKKRYHYPSVIQFMPVNVAVTEDPKFTKFKSDMVSFLVHYGQTVQLFAMNLNISIVASNNRDTYVGSIDLKINCGGCKTRTILIENIRDEKDFGRRNITDYIDWPDPIPPVKYVDLEIVPTAPANVRYTVDGKFVVVVQNALPQKRGLQK